MNEEKIVATGIIIGSVIGTVCAILSTIFLPLIVAACVGTASLAGGTFAGASIAGELVNMFQNSVHDDKIA